MAGTLISKIVNGEDNSTSFTNLQQSMLMLMRSHDGMMFNNFYKGSVAAPNVARWSSVAVNYNVYKWAAHEDILYLAASGATSALDSAPAAEYLLVAVVDSDSNCTIYARKASEVQIIGSAEYGGWYINTTQNRVLGGFTKNSDGTYTRKWKYPPYGVPISGTGMEMFRDYADGFVAKPYINTTPRVLYSIRTITDFQTDSPAITTDIQIDYPCILWVTANGFVYRAYSKTTVPTANLKCDIYCFHSDNITELFRLNTVNLVFRGSGTGTGGHPSSTQNTGITITPGKYRLKLYNGNYVSGNLINDYPAINALDVYARNETSGIDTIY